MTFAPVVNHPLTVPVGEYEILNLLSLLEAQLNAVLFAIDGSSCTWTLNGGKVRLQTTTQIVQFRLDDMNLNILGYVVSLPPSQDITVTNTPTYITENVPAWTGYNFDNTGAIYNGDMTITGALTVSTIISDLEIEDALITLNKNAANDNNTSGFVLNNTNDSLFSGLLKNGNSNDFYLFANSAILPTETGWTPEYTGNLFINSVKVNDLTGSGTISVKGINTTNPVISVDTLSGHTAPLQEWKADGFVQASLSNNGRLDANIIDCSTIGCTNFTIGLSGGTYTFPTSRGANGEILITDGSGNVSWQPNPSSISDRIISPNTLNNVIAGNTDIQINFGGFVRETIDANNTYFYSPNGVSSYMRLGNNTFIARVDNNDRLSIGTSESVLRAPNLSNRISVANIATRVTGEFEVNGLAEFQVKAQTNDSVPLQLGSTSSTATQKPITMKFVANAVIPAGRVVKIVNVGGLGRVEPVANNDPDDTGVAGITYTSSVNIGDDIEVTVGGVWEACLLEGNTVEPGDPIEKSGTGGVNLGRVETAPTSRGTFGIALTGGTGDVGGTVFIRGIYKKNESF